MDSKTPVSHGMKVLLVDPEMVSLISTANMLATNSYNVTAVGFGYAAMKSILTGDKNFDMAIINTYLPDMDGFQLCRDIEKMGILVVVTSTNEDPRLTYKALERGASLVIKKPIDSLTTKYLYQFMIKQRVMKNKKKTCVEWTTELHQKFMDAVIQLGEGNCYPIPILKRMNVPGLTREQVASHLQKCRRNHWRSHTERKNRSQKNKISTDATSTGKTKVMYGVMPVVNGQSQPKVHSKFHLVPASSSDKKLGENLQASSSGKAGSSRSDVFPPIMTDNMNNLAASSSSVHGYGDDTAPTEKDGAPAMGFYIGDEEMNFFIPECSQITQWTTFGTK